MTASEKDHSSATSRISPGSAILAGLIGSFANTIAIRVVQATPIPPGTGGFAKLVLAMLAGALDKLGLPWRVPLNFGPFGQEVFHTVVGVSMALLYALVFYRHLRGPGWLRGFIFCQIPWLIQAFIVLPWMGSGMLGLRLSPWTPAASFALNAVFGLALGGIYRPKTIHATPA